ncbi:MAG TPA: DUF6795 domain-containing protein [Limnobacter sp.]|nr:DUF6795 domain-containing protein [Limnobacter sp.]
MKRELLALLVFAFLPLTSEAFVFKKIVYCSPIEGVVHWAGKPLADVTVTRELYSGGFKNNKYEDRATTTTNGKFGFAVVEERRLFRPDLLSSSPSVAQIISLSYEGIRYGIWAFNKLDYLPGTESIGGFLKLNCDLSKFEEDSDGRTVRCSHNGVRQP